MKRTGRTFASVAAALAISAGSVAADPIQITAGAFAMPGVGGAAASITLSGEGFTFSANTGPSDALIWPHEQCNLPECTAGTTVGLLTTVGGLGLRNATATYQGITYQRVGGLGTFDAAMGTTWDGSLVIPAGFTGGVLTAPVTFVGLFSYWTGTEFRNVDLFGAGTATVTFVPYGGGAIYPGAFSVQSLRYDFETTAPPVPEPASLLLLATGLAGIAAARRRRQTQNKAA